MKFKYLEEPGAKGRMLVAAGLVGAKVRGGVVVDLNCGRTPLFAFLPRTMRKYVGNCTDGEVVAHLKRVYPAGTWLECADGDIPELVGLDVLLCLGWEQGRSAGKAVTLDDTVMTLIYQHGPGVVVLETACGTAKLEAFNELVDWVVENGYQESGMWEVRPWQAASSILERRGVVLLEKAKGRREKK